MKKNADKIINTKENSDFLIDFTMSISPQPPPANIYLIQQFIAAI